ncbi:endothelin-2-like [Suncus etruscus]|uniref:endothelin-2-like n=1 Tax=Suncus etruscus TaxID=109475 RepID=UPI00210F396A|nr:endothelin-2-like [Suncus etruscus]
MTLGDYDFIILLGESGTNTPTLRGHRKSKSNSDDRLLPVSVDHAKDCQNWLTVIDWDMMVNNRLQEEFACLAVRLTSSVKSVYIKEQTAPYGLGNPPRRRRRSLPRRCECSRARDSACATFCHRRPRMTAMEVPGSRPPANMLQAGKTWTHAGELLQKLRDIATAKIHFARQEQKALRNSRPMQSRWRKR